MSICHRLSIIVINYGNTLYFIQFSIREASKAMGWWDNPPTGMKVIAPVSMQQFYAKVININISIE